MATPATTLSDLSSRQSQLFFTPHTCTAMKPWSTRVNVRSRQRPILAIVAFSLPTAKQPERGSSPSPPPPPPSSSASPGKIPKWSRRAIKSFAMAELEARKLKYPTTGTEALLMGLLIEGTSTASKFLRANGVTLTKVREEALKIIPKGDMYFFSPEHPPLTDDAQRALDWALEQKLKSVFGSRSVNMDILRLSVYIRLQFKGASMIQLVWDDGEITTSHLLLGIWSEVESPGHKILVSLGFDD